MKKNFDLPVKLGVTALFITAFVLLAPETSANVMDSVKSWFVQEKQETALSNTATEAVAEKENTKAQETDEIRDESAVDSEKAPAEDKTELKEEVAKNAEEDDLELKEEAAESEEIAAEDEDEDADEDFADADLESDDDDSVLDDLTEENIEPAFKFSH